MLSKQEIKYIVDSLWKIHDMKWRLGLEPLTPEMEKYVFNTLNRIIYLVRKSGKGVEYADEAEKHLKLASIAKEESEKVIHLEIAFHRLHTWLEVYGSWVETYETETPKWFKKFVFGSSWCLVSPIAYSDIPLTIFHPPEGIRKVITESKFIKILKIYTDTEQYVKLILYRHPIYGYLLYFVGEHQSGIWEYLLKPKENRPPHIEIKKPQYSEFDTPKNFIQKIPPEIIKIMKIVRGYLVGGSVRDLLMGKIPSDYDIATPYTPDEVEQILHTHGIRTYEVGKRFGTVGAIVGKYKVEITTFRKETYDFITRKPKVVYTKNIYEDLGRRDFTINAIAMDAEGNLIDPFHGFEDLKRGIIRFVGNPKERILEDPLRILRAFRFAARFGFKIDPQSQNALKNLVGELKRISKERIKDEFVKAANTDRFALYCDLNYKFGAFLYYGPTWAEVIPLMSKIKHSPGYHHYGETIWQHTIDVLNRMDKWHYPARIKIAGFFHDIGKPKTAKKIGEKIHFYEHEDIGAKLTKKMMRELKFSNKEIDYTVFLVKNHMRMGIAIAEYNKGNVRPLARLIAKAIMENHSRYLVDLCYLMMADTNTTIPVDVINKIKIASEIKPPKFSPELLKKIPPTQRRAHIYGRLVEKIIQLLTA